MNFSCTPCANNTHTDTSRCDTHIRYAYILYSYRHMYKEKETAANGTAYACSKRKLSSWKLCVSALLAASAFVRAQSLRRPFAFSLLDIKTKPNRTTLAYASCTCIQLYKALNACEWPYAYTHTVNTLYTRRFIDAVWFKANFICSFWLFSMMSYHDQWENDVLPLVHTFLDTIWWAKSFSTAFLQAKTVKNKVSSLCWWVEQAPVFHLIHFDMLLHLAIIHFEHSK